MKFILCALLAYGLTLPTRAETWIHVYRYDTPKISAPDPAPFDEYLDTDFAEIDGKWTFIRTKTVSDEASNEFHGKMTISILAYSCRERKFAILSSTQFDDEEGLQIHFKQYYEKDKLDRLATNIFRPFVNPIDGNAPAMIYLRYACLGIPPMQENLK
jgi:hypothetical protein